MKDQSLIDELRELEVALHRSDVRSDQRQLEELLHQHFWEVGRSGAIWSRESTMSEFAAHPQPYSVWAQDFKVEEIAPGISLLTYRSAHIGDGGRLERHTRRASLWAMTGGGWRMRFHQGTPTEAFDKHAT